MPPSTQTDRLSQLSTSWSAILRAHDTDAPREQAQAAQEELLRCYELPVRRYLRGAFREWPNRDDLAEEAFQTFAVRFLTGSFKGASPERGRFRDYLKTSLRNLVTDLQRRERQRHQALGEHDPAVEDASLAESERELLAAWREQLVARALRALEALEQRTGQSLYTVLQFVMDHREMRSAEVAAELKTRMNKEVNAGWVRKRLCVARKELATFLMEEVARSLGDPTDDQVDQEMADLGLLEYCRGAIDARRKP